MFPFFPFFMARQPTPAYDTMNYSVKPGDTLYSIAKEFNSTVENILKFNNIPNPNLIHIGMMIIIPLSPPEAIIYTVVPGDTVYSIAQKYRTSVINIVKYNYLSNPNSIFPGQHLVVTASLR